MKVLMRRLALGAALIAPAVLASTSQNDARAIEAAARRYPNFTTEQNLEMLRVQRMRAHPFWKDLSWSEQLVLAVKYVSHAAQARLRSELLGAQASSSGPTSANFQGNFTAIVDTNGQALGLQRQSNCSLTLFTGNLLLGATPTVQVLATSTDYQNVLHTEAGLTTQAGVFANGCAEPTLGISSRRTIFMGQASSTVYLSATSAYDATTGNQALYYISFDPNTQTVYPVHADSSFPSISAIAPGDLNGDGLADIVGISNASGAISVWLTQANGTLSTPTVYTLTGTSTEAAVVADVNGDGKPDVVVATIDSTTSQETIFVLPGAGNGTLGTPQSFTVTTPRSSNGASQAIVSLIAADLRGNGRMDLVGSNGMVLLNNGGGAFTQASPAFAPLQAASSFAPNLVAADLNKDGKIDLAVDNGQSIHTYLGAGNGTFTAGNAYLSNTEVGYISATDLDGDGNVDLYIGLANGGAFAGDQFDATQSYALMGNGDGSFRGAPLLPFVYMGSNLVDLNGDGKVDGIGVNSDYSLTVYLGDGSGGFTAKSTLTTSPITIGGTSYTGGSIDSMAIGDVNGDGKPDLAYIVSGFLGPNSVPGVFIALGDGQGDFATPTFYPVPTTLAVGDIDINWTILDVHLADLNGDGKADLIYNYEDTSSIHDTTYFGNVVQIGNGNSTFQAPKAIVYRSAAYNGSFTPAYTAYVASITDLNGDGHPDLVFLTQTSTIDQTLSTYVSNIQVALGHGDGSFSTPTTVTGPNIMAQCCTDQEPPSIVVADMNGDGKPDIVALGSSTSTYDLQVGIALGNGDGTFKAPVLTTYSGQYLNTGQQISVADFNGDGIRDVAITNPYDSSNSGISYGNGDGSLQTIGTSPNAQLQLLINVPVYGASVALDINGDGKPDILAGTTELLSQAVSGSSPSLALALSSTAGTVSPGQSASTVVTLTPSNGFAATLALSCSGLPTGATCSFSPASVAVNGSAGQSNLTIATAAASAAAVAGTGPTDPWLKGGALLLLALAAPLAWYRRRLPEPVRRTAWLGAVLLGGLGLAGLWFGRRWRRRRYWCRRRRRGRIERNTRGHLHRERQGHRFVDDASGDIHTDGELNGAFGACLFEDAIFGAPSATGRPAYPSLSLL